MTNKFSPWQRVRDPTMTPEERAALFAHLRALGRRVHVKPYMLTTLLNQIADDMDLRKEARERTHARK